MKTLVRVNGDTLTFKFSPSGALSSARFNKQDVTARLRFIREEDCARLLEFAGFAETCDRDTAEVYSAVKGWVDSVGLSVFKIKRGGACDSNCHVYLCDTLHKEVLPKLVATALFLKGASLPLYVSWVGETK